MDSLPQETIDAIVDHLPHSSLRSSSLVARRWSTRSQRRIFGRIQFFSSDQVNRWYSVIQRDGSRILPYVHSVEFQCINSWNDPPLLGRVLKGLCSLTMLGVYECAIPDELPGQILRGEFGRGITTLSLEFPFGKISTMTSMILSLPDLKKLIVRFDETKFGQPSSTSGLIASQRRSLDVLELYLYPNKVAEALLQSRFTSRYISLNVAIPSAHRLLAISSETLVALTLGGARPLTGSKATEAILTIFLDTWVGTHTPPIDLPSFPALTSLRVRLYETKPSRRVIDVLSFISSTPALASFDVQYAISDTGKPIPSDEWDDLDRWLARVAKHAVVERGLVLNLRRWAFSESSWEEFLQRFREAGGEIRTHARGWTNYDSGFGGPLL